MDLTYELGDEVIQRLRPHLDVPINLMDTNGKIVASSDPERIDQLHSGAVRAIEIQQELLLYPKDVTDYPGTKPGVNLPMYFFGELVGVVGITGHPNQVIQAANITKAAVEIALEQIHLQKQTAFQENTLYNWLLQLLHPYGFDEEKLEQEAKHILKIDLTEPLVVVVLQSQNPSVFTEEIRQKLDAVFVSMHEEHELVLAVKEVEPPETVLLPLLEANPDLCIGVGNSGIGVKAIRESYYQAKQAMKFSTEKRFTRIEEWKLEQLIDQIPHHTYEDVITTYAECLRNMEGSYEKTLHVYFQSNLELKETAVRLHIHRNTLMYRLDQIHEKVGLNPRMFKDAMLLYILCFKQ